MSLNLYFCWSKIQSPHHECTCMMMCDVSNKNVTTSGNMSNTVNHCQSSHMWSDSIVKEQKTGDLFSEYALMCRRTELPCLYFFFFLTKHLYQEAAHISGVMAVFVRQVSLWWLLHQHELHVLRAPNGFHARSWNPRRGPRGSLALSICVQAAGRADCFLVFGRKQ